MGIPADPGVVGVAVPDLNEIVSEVPVVARQHRTGERMTLPAGSGGHVNPDVFSQQGSNMPRARAVTSFATDGGLLPGYVDGSGTAGP